MTLVQIHGLIISGGINGGVVGGGLFLDILSQDWFDWLALARLVI